MPRNPLQLVEWYVTPAVMESFREHITMLQEVPEGSDEFYALVEEIRSMPNFPQGIDPDHAHIFPVLTTHTVN